MFSGWCTHHSEEPMARDSCSSRACSSGRVKKPRARAGSSSLTPVPRSTPLSVTLGCLPAPKTGGPPAPRNHSPDPTSRRSTCSRSRVSTAIAVTFAAPHSFLRGRRPYRSRSRGLALLYPAALANEAASIGPGKIASCDTMMAAEGFDGKYDAISLTSTKQVTYGIET